MKDRNFLWRSFMKPLKNDDSMRWKFVSYVLTEEAFKDADERTKLLHRTEAITDNHFSAEIFSTRKNVKFHHPSQFFWFFRFMTSKWASLPMIRRNSLINLLFFVYWRRTQSIYALNTWTLNRVRKVNGRKGDEETHERREERRNECDSPASFLKQKRAASLKKHWEGSICVVIRY